MEISCIAGVRLSRRERPPVKSSTARRPRIESRRCLSRPLRPSQKPSGPSPREGAPREAVPREQPSIIPGRRRGPRCAHLPKNQRLLSILFGRSRRCGFAMTKPADRSADRRGSQPLSRCDPDKARLKFQRAQRERCVLKGNR